MLNRAQKCLGNLVDDGHLSRADAEAVWADIQTRQKRLAETMALPDAERLAVEQAFAAKQAEAVRRKYLIALQAHTVKRIDAIAGAHPDGRQAGYLAVLTKDWTGKARAATNVEYRASALHALFDRAALELFDRYKPTALGFKEQTPGLRLVLRELFGEDTKDASAKAGAKAWRETSEKMREMFNRAGGDVGHIDDWRLPQSHDAVRIRAAGFDAWSRMADEAGVEIRGRDGAALVGPERLVVLREVWETLASGGANKSALGSAGNGVKLANKGREARVLHFASPDGWLKYHQEFGSGSLYSTFAGHVKAMSRDIAALEVLGPNPAAMVRYMTDMADRAEPGAGRTIDRTAQALFGSAEVAHGWRRYLYAGMQNTRNLLRSAQMGSATLSAIADFATIGETAAWNGLDSIRAMKFYAGQLNPADGADRAMARRTGLIADITNRAIGNSRAVDDDMAKGFFAKLAGATFELSGLNAHTNGARAAFQMETMASLADRVGKGWADLDQPFRNMLERHGLDAAMWDKARAQPLLDHDGVKFMDGLGLADSADPHIREAGLRLHAAILAETDMAVPMADARVRGMMNLGTSANTLAGELVRTIGMYRSYPVTVMMTHGSRLFHGSEATGRTRGLVIAHGFATFAGMTALGAMAVQMKAISTGRDPRDMTDPKFWASAAAQGGGLGIMGDFFNAALSRTDKDLAGTLAGTGYGLLTDVLNLTTRNAMAEADGKPGASAGDYIRFLQRYSPGSNLWWAKTATDRLFWNQLMLAADPHAPADFARLEKRALRDYGQKFWARPGQGLPDRAPDLSAAFGGTP